MLSKTVFIHDVTEGQEVYEVFVIVQAKLSQSKNGPFWDLTLQDKTGRLNAKIWSPQSNAYAQLLPEQVVRIQGQVRSFRDQPQLVVQKLEVVDPQEVGDWADFIPSSSRPPEQILSEIEGLCREHLRYPPWRKLLKAVLSDAAMRECLVNAPGAKNIHHAYRGGLVEHTLQVVRLCLAVCELYPDLDREILLVAAVLHDMGKAWELDGGISRDYTDAGRLVGHITLGVDRVMPFVARVQDLDPDLSLHLEHLLLSHHGEYSYGSPRRPKTQEAFVLHFMDNLDAKMNTLDQALTGIAPGAQGWSAYQPSLERMVYRPKKTYDLLQPERKSKTRNAKQCLLPLKE
ncbi:3'-5' exoribonuclease YhaM family protein [Desulfovermiculus halophilus]|jgi:3'-5' exoribonuclease|uniref:3'-5' exoribonuclease YhaM family protein n=1 Tax=Desulfovermiculus halophilus TaxID=339722 RepID=UPI000553838A|nr:HD domain-containing protein [Desulfovermiculus halophilus]